ncbi:Unknown protein [Striga hermonthica]|uniref:Uncharacterized protein n=1 Tax=Striga hermonthica TaxID=68872 RepID=A0A9N7NP49_STRHE|nr:Unknown protein [Striga hermonthica]
MSDKQKAKADDGDGEEGPTNAKENNCKGCGKKSRRLSFLRLRKREKRGISVNPGCLGRRGVGGGGRWGCSCLGQPRTLDSSGESPTSDPNSSEFTFDMLRALIEKNDFYSKDCNPHLDQDSY